MTQFFFTDLLKFETVGSSGCSENSSNGARSPVVEPPKVHIISWAKYNIA